VVVCHQHRAFFFDRVLPYTFSLAMMRALPIGLTLSTSSAVVGRAFSGPRLRSRAINRPIPSRWLRIIGRPDLTLNPSTVVITGPSTAPCSLTLKVTHATGAANLSFGESCINIADAGANGAWWLGFGVAAGDVCGKVYIRPRPGIDLLSLLRDHAGRVRS